VKWRMGIFGLLFYSTLSFAASYKVAFSQDNLQNDWRLAQLNELQTAFKAYPKIHLIHTDARGSISKQISDIEHLSHSDIDLLIVSPAHEEVLAPVIASVYHRGIPVLLLERHVKGDAYTTYIHPDNASIATHAAHRIAKRLGGKGDLIILKGLNGTTPTRLRTDLFLKALKAWPKIQVRAMETANYLRTDALKAVQKLLYLKTPFDAIYAQSDSMAEGARIALKRSGIDPASKVIVGIDYIKEAKEAILRGEQDASYYYSTCAKEGAKAAWEILQGRSVPKEIMLPTLEITKANAASHKALF